MRCLHLALGAAVLMSTACNTMSASQSWGQEADMYLACSVDQSITIEARQACLTRALYSMRMSEAAYQAEWAGYNSSKSIVLDHVMTRQTIQRNQPRPVVTPYQPTCWVDVPSGERVCH